MSSLKKRQPAAEEDDLDITPMIDVTFLLLIFFMVTSNMEQSAQVAIPPAKHGLGVSVADSTVITIFRTDDEPEIYLADGEKKNGPVDVSEVTAYVQTGITDRKFNVIIKADRDIPSGFVEEVARAANEVETEEDLKFFVGVVDKQEK